ncbi:MAG: hypothetical protein A3C35_05505 [Omnitrophica bacterium RIFCSPHIGHO2_02_FULL_46_11]|nr:MAG: hypothetical protein A3C35_05505 [Omnitrophica bacterium RIFCSPHIGHO2_02_FULL_46_11]OGW87974.1 MAG: hypothetical protein A3A81_06670 [Omnitrophica bacterium RIFCSPLOWO2_01_FULL_45_10b]
MSANIPVNLYTVQKPLVGVTVENKSLTTLSHGPKNDVRHVVIRHKEKLPYLPGQSVGVIMPGIDPLTGKPHKLRLYSVASVRNGDFGDGQTVSLCVVRHFWDNPKTGEKGIPGLSSNYLCDLKKGDLVTLTGPVGRHFLLPDDFKNRDFIFVATGTGIAPYRGMLKEMFEAGFEGRVWLYFGVQYGDVVLYDKEFETYRKHKNFFYIKAISREEKNPIPSVIPTRENRMYVQVKMYQDCKALGETLAKKDSMVYLCGLKGMEAGIFPVLEKIGAEFGVKESFVAKLKAEQRLRVEVY